MENQIDLQLLTLTPQNNWDVVQNLFVQWVHSFNIQEEISWTTLTSAPWIKFSLPETASQETMLIAFMYVALFSYLDHYEGENFEDVCNKYLEILEGGMPNENDSQISYALFDFMQKLSAQGVSIHGFIERAKKVVDGYKGGYNIRQNKARVDLKTYQNIRSVTVNVYPWWELWQILGGYTLTTAEKNTPEMRNFLHLAAAVMYLANDIYSLKKEQQNGALNYVSILSSEGGISAADAFHLTRILLHQRKVDFERIYERILETNENPDLHRFVGFVKKTIDQGFRIVQKGGEGRYNLEQYNVDAYARGLSFLTKLHKQNGFQCFISSSPDMLRPVETPETLFPGLTEFPCEIFTPMMITDLVFKDKPELKISSNLVTEVKSYQGDGGIFNFFNDGSLLPADIDCTAIGLAILVEAGQIDLNIAHQVVDKILDTVNEDGIIQVYFPPCGHRCYVDPSVCVNVLYLMALLGREKEAQKTEAYVFEHLRTKAYLAGTRYYPSPDIFLYFLARLINKSAYYREKFKDQLRQALEKRIGTTQSPLDFAARVITARAVGISNDLDESGLLLSQNGRDGWPANAFFKFGKRHGFFGCEALTTAFALKALETQALYEQAWSRYNYNAIYEADDAGTRYSDYRQSSQANGGDARNFLEIKESAGQPPV